MYEDDFETVEKKKEGQIGKKADRTKMTTKDRHEMWRNKFMNNLSKVGLEMEEVGVLHWFELKFSDDMNLGQNINLVLPTHDGRSRNKSG